MNALNDMLPAGIARWRAMLHSADRPLLNTVPWLTTGRVKRARGLILEATGLRLALGAACRIEIAPGNDDWVDADVVGFDGHTLYLMPHTDLSGLQPGARVAPLLGQTAEAGASAVSASRRLPVGSGLLGRVLDANGRPLDGQAIPADIPIAALTGPALNPMARAPIDKPLDVGVRAINGLLTVGRGQRMGLFAGAGVGKSVLLGMMARHTQADITIVGLIGERSREVREFIEHNLGPAGLRRAIVVAAPAGESPLLRLQAAAYAARLAEYFRDQGRHVLLIMDSLTRYAMAQRELALAVGEPPATKGYPPSVFARLAGLVERAGNGSEHPSGEHGSITAFYTVLTEGDDPQDPIADAARSILDGHIVLSRHLAEAGHYPAIDVEASISRVMHTLVGQDHMRKVHRFKQTLATWQRNRDLVAVGAYAPGSDPGIDAAIHMYPQLERYLQQDVHEHADFASAAAALHHLFPDSASRTSGGATPTATYHA